MGLSLICSERVFICITVCVCVSICDSLEDANICCGSLVKHFRGVVGVLSSEQLNRRVANLSQRG